MPSTTKSPTEKKSRNMARGEPPPDKPTVRIRKRTTATAEINPSAAPILTSEARYQLIAKTAYFLAEKRGFQNGSPEQDWFDAAVQVDKLFMG